MSDDARNEESRGPRGGNSDRSIPPGADLDNGYATDDWPTATHEEHDQPVANPDRTTLDDDDETENRVHDQNWPKVADEVRKAVKEADGPLA